MARPSKMQEFIDRKRQGRRARVLSVSMNDEMWDIVEVLMEKYNAGASTVVKALIKAYGPNA